MQSLISTVAFGFGCGYIGQYEQQGVGAQFSNMATSAVPEDSYNLMGCIVMMLADSVIYWLIAWYIEAVFPGQHNLYLCGCYQFVKQRGSIFYFFICNE